MPTKFEEMLDAQAEAEPEEETPAEVEETDEAEEEAEQEPTVEAPEGSSGIDDDALKRESRRHTKQMMKLLGDLFPDAAMCTYCDGSGVTPESLERLPDLLYDPTTEGCTVCGCRGLLKTHSLREGQIERSCSNCAGNGYVSKAVQLPPPMSAAAQVAVAYPQPPAGLPPQIPSGTLDVLRAAGYIVMPPPDGSPGLAP